MSQNKKNNPNDLSSWFLPIFLLMIFPPFGFLLIVLKLLGGQKPARGRHPYYTSRDSQQPVGARTVGKTASAESSTAASKPTSPKKRGEKQSSLQEKQKKGKKLSAIGAAICAISAFILAASIGDSAHWLLNGELYWFFEEMLELLPFFCTLGGGAGCLWAGQKMQKQAQRFRNYLAMVGRQKSVSITALASATGRTPKQVRDDLEDMFNEGLFPAGFLDYGGDRLVLSSDGLQDDLHTAQPQPTPTPSSQEENAILDEIRAVNEAISNEKMSAQIDRIGVITAKILDYQKSHPEKSPQLHSFLSYYLPTTLKILRAYGQLEAQDVSGENITAAMQRIETMMDKVVEGFEKQLDQLFQGDMMDITSDVDVLERMLAKDGLSSSGQTLTLGL